MMMKNFIVSIQTESLLGSGSLLAPSDGDQEPMSPGGKPAGRFLLGPRVGS